MRSPRPFVFVTPRLRRLVVLSRLTAAVLLAAGCAATSPSVKSGGTSVTVDIKNNRNARPGTVRLAAADYTLDGKPVLALRDQGHEDVPDAATWTGAIVPGDHVLGATLHYPARSASLGLDMQFEVHREFRFRSRRGDAVRIRVEEAVAEAGFTTASVDQRLGVKFQQY